MIPPPPDGANAACVSLFGNGSFTLSGVNGWRRLLAVPITSPTRSCSNLTLRTIADQCAFALGQNADVTPLADEHAHFRLWPPGSRGGRTLITNAPGDDAAMLTVTGGDTALALAATTA